MNEKRPVKVKVGVHFCEVITAWNNSTLKFIDQAGDQAPRIVTIEIEYPSDIQYIREQLNKIESAWHKELDAICVIPAQREA
jgi:hypothetical protein